MAQVVWVVVPLPWTRVAVKAPRFAPVAVAKVTFTVLFEWLMLPALLVWHSVQATGL